MSDNESSSSYCLLSNGDLHFLPYSDSKDDQANFENYPLYSTFLNNKTVSSFDIMNNSNIVTTSDSYENNSINNSNNHSNNNSNKTQIVKLLENYKSHAIYLPDDFIPLNKNSDQTNIIIKSLLFKIFNHWNLNDEIKIKKLTGGITNMLLECTYINSKSKNDIEKVLVRTYGNGTDLIIDRDREFVSHLVLNSLTLAPSIHARFGNGLVYGYIEGCSLNFDQLSSSCLYPLIASKLACLHKLTNVNVIDDSLNKLKLKFHQSDSLQTSSNSTSSPQPSLLTSNQLDIWSVLFDWVQKLSNIPSMKELCLRNKDILSLNSINNNTSLVDILLNEIEWLKHEIQTTSIQVTSHNDLLSGNIIIPSSLNNYKTENEFKSIVKNFTLNPLSFIDYEYMMPAPRAFDIANHFMEWQGFDCNKSKIPKFNYNKITKNYENDIIFNWCKYYLTSFNSINPDSNPYLNDLNDNKNIIQSKTIQLLVNEIAYHYGMPGLYWGIWAGIQSEISLIDFDYSTYSCERLIEYWNWKRFYLSNK
ncbi:hypothetical protein C6P40_002453 [Pichia californica]|uniref:ethanolamine kinase n=1 Tax=Pichia californica TaxID=460514 RepID=A0A9P6WJQ0_9ASCO|nr:hypothetical protein C6P42_002393 [[Candida] californica]KAG0687367.1 hypothetical protein C6P40_002453 [[Candida] californica]